LLNAEPADGCACDACDNPDQSSTTATSASCC
jgi:hypothetical protein